MSVADRILAACCGDSDQADLVLDTLARRVTLRDLGLCVNCKQPFDDGICPLCGRLDNDRPAPHESSGRARRGPEEE